MEGLKKIQSVFVAAPIGAACGAIAGMLVAKQTGFHKTLMIVSFTTVGMIIGATISNSFKK